MLTITNYLESESMIKMEITYLDHLGYPKTFTLKDSSKKGIILKYYDVLGTYILSKCDELKKLSKKAGLEIPKELVNIAHLDFGSLVATIHYPVKRFDHYAKDFTMRKLLKMYKDAIIEGCEHMKETIRKYEKIRQDGNKAS